MPSCREGDRKGFRHDQSDLSLVLCAPAPPLLSLTIRTPQASDTLDNVKAKIQDKEDNKAGLRTAR